MFYNGTVSTMADSSPIYSSLVNGSRIFHRWWSVGSTAEIRWQSNLIVLESMPRLAGSDSFRRADHTKNQLAVTLTHDEVTEACIGWHPGQCHTGRNMHHIRRAAIAGIWAHESTRIRWSADGPVIVKTMISKWSSYAATDDYWAARIDNHKTMMLPPCCRCWYDQRNLTSYCKNTWGFFILWKIKIA